MGIKRAVVAGCGDDDGARATDRVDRNLKGMRTVVCPGTRDTQGVEDHEWLSAHPCKIPHPRPRVNDVGSLEVGSHHNDVGIGGHAPVGDRRTPNGFTRQGPASTDGGAQDVCAVTRRGIGRGRTTGRSVIGSVHAGCAGGNARRRPTRRAGNSGRRVPHVNMGG